MQSIESHSTSLGSDADSVSAETACILCGKSRLKILALETRTSRIKEVGGEVLVKCTGCGLTFASPRPSIAYDEAFYRAKRLVNGPAGGESELRPHLQQRLFAVETYFGSQSPLRILELGCSRGLFLKFAKQRGHEVLGVEVSEFAAQIVRDAGIPVVVGDVREANIPARSIDFIHMNHVLEHIENPYLILSHLAGLLSDQGIIVIEVPNEFENLTYKLNRYFRPDTLIRVVPTQHSYFFSPKTLRSVLTAAGFNVFKISTASQVRARHPLFKAKQYLIEKYLLGGNIEIWAKRTDQQKSS